VGLGKPLRTAFTAAAGCTLVSADYSQIELRLLAHMAGIEALQDAFNHGVDVHSLTASQVVPVYTCVCARGNRIGGVDVRFLTASQARRPLPSRLCTRTPSPLS
jgi:hypothetical protein